MEVILLKEVKRLGNPGDVKRVAEGYARNYLIPRGLAIPATEAARKQIAAQVAVEVQREENEKATAQAQATNLEKVVLTFKAKTGESGRLYGSITNADIAEQLAEKTGQEIDKRKVLLEEPIKETGKFKVDIKLHPDVRFTVTVVVASEEAAS